MFEGFQREAAQGSLCDLREQGITDLRTVGRNAGNAVCNRQPDGAKREFRDAASRQIIDAHAWRIGARMAMNFVATSASNASTTCARRWKLSTGQKGDPFRRMPRLDFAPFGYGRGFEELTSRPSPEANAWLETTCQLGLVGLVFKCSAPISRVGKPVDVPRPRSMSSYGQNIHGHARPGRSR